MKVAFVKDLSTEDAAKFAKEFEKGKISTDDVVVVVRCKNCKHWHEGTQWCNEHSYFVDSDGEPCHPSESPNWKMFEPDYYCGSGERKDEKVDS